MKTVETCDDGATQVTLLNLYEPGTNLDQVIALIDFDRRLRWPYVFGLNGTSGSEQDARHHRFDF